MYALAGGLTKQTQAGNGLLFKFIGNGSPSQWPKRKFKPDMLTKQLPERKISEK